MTGAWASAVAATARRDPWPALITATLCGWVLLVIGGPSLAVARLCGSGVAGLGFAFSLVDPAGLAWSWFVMLLAMTPLLLAQPVRRLWRGSLCRQRSRAVTAFLAGYVGVWMAAGGALVTAAIVLRALSGPLALPYAAAMTVAWQITPSKRACLLRGHQVPSLRAFGRDADLDSLRYGLSAGLWCVGSCWALMLVTMTTDVGHLVAMPVVAALMFLERHVSPTRGQWRTLPA